MKKTNASLLTFGLILFLTTLACSRSSRITSTTDSTNTLTHDNLERTYILHVPSSYDDSHTVPLVLDFHGGGGNAENQIRVSGFSALADEKGFIVAYPNGTGKLNDKLLTWNSGTCCSYAVDHNIDDVGFVRALITEVESKYKIDPKRIYATGFSNGGIMSQRLACDASDIFTAIAPVSGTLNYPQCNPAQPVSIIEFHGTEDTHIQYNGGAGPDSLVDIPFTSVKDTISFWLNKDQCAQTPETKSYLNISHDTYNNCNAGTAVELYTIIGGKHAWPGSNGPAGPGGDEPVHSISATQLIWEFFVAHPKP